MALKNKSLFTFGLEVTAYNRNLDFKIVSGGPEQNAVLNLGYYSPASLANEIVRAMTEANNTVFYFSTIDRSYLAGTENRITISTSASFFEIYFSGTHANNLSTLIGFYPNDYTGALTYTSYKSIGIVLMTEFPAYTYRAPFTNKEITGARSISASGVKETIVFQIMQFVEAEFKYEPVLKVENEWDAFLTWAIQQRTFDFTPEFDNYNLFYECTLETTGRNSNGIGFLMTEMLPKFPDLYTTSNLKMRKKV